MTLKLTLRAKLIYLTVFLLVSFGLSLTVYLKTHFVKVLTAELLNRGVSISRHVAEICTEAFIEHDFLQLDSLAIKHQTTENDIVYILMLNQNEQVIAHSFSNGYPLDLDKIVHTMSDKEPSIQKLDFGGVPLYDIAAPVMDARIGTVRIGISAQPIHQAINTMVEQILCAIIILGVVALLIALPALQTIIRPISLLNHAVEQLTLGEEVQQLPVSSNDELGLLTEAFNQMMSTIKTADQNLAAHIEFLQVLIDDIPIPVFYKDQQGVMLGCNRAYTDFWGKSKEEVVGCHTGNIYLQPEAELHLRKDREVLNQKAHVCYDHSVVDAKGQRRHVIINKAPFCDESGQPEGIIGVIHDITEQRQADHMKSEFVSTVAHEFQTPLATILGFVELIQEQMLSPGEQEESLKLIANKTESLSEMVDELLDLARIETSKGLTINLEACNVNAAMTELFQSFKKRTVEHHFVLELPESEAVVPADKTRMGQVMENLLSNAVKYSVKPSNIKVSVTNHEGYCQVQVADQGIGMTKEQAGKVFEKYYRADTSNTAPSGTGLGLFITKSIIDAHNGKIAVESTPGKGTTVTFQIPTQTV